MRLSPPPVLPWLSRLLGGPPVFRGSARARCERTPRERELMHEQPRNLRLAVTSYSTAGLAGCSAQESDRGPGGFASRPIVSRRAQQRCSLRLRPLGRSPVRRNWCSPQASPGPSLLLALLPFPSARRSEFRNTAA